MATRSTYQNVRSDIQQKANCSKVFLFKQENSDCCQEATWKEDLVLSAVQSSRNIGEEILSHLSSNIHLHSLTRLVNKYLSIFIIKRIIFTAKETILNYQP